MRGMIICVLFEVRRESRVMSKERNSCFENCCREAVAFAGAFRFLLPSYLLPSSNDQHDGEGGSAKKPLTRNDPSSMCVSLSSICIGLIRVDLVLLSTNEFFFFEFFFPGDSGESENFELDNAADLGGNAVGRRSHPSGRVNLDDDY